MKIGKIIILFIFIITPVITFAESKHIGVVSDMEGDVFFYIQKEEKKVSPGMFVQSGTRVVTKDNSRLKIMMMDDSLLVIAPKTEIVIDEYIVDVDKKSRKSLIGLIRGKVLIFVNKLFSGQQSKFEVKTKTSIAGVRGTRFVIESAEKDFIGVFDGELEVTDGKINNLVGAGKCADSKNGFAVVEFDKNLIGEYQSEFKIRNSKTKVAMINTGTRMSGESILYHGSLSSGMGVLKEKIVEAESQSGYYSQSSVDVPSDKIDSTQEAGDFQDIEDNKGPDVRVGGRTVLNIKIVLPFVVVKR